MPKQLIGAKPKLQADLQKLLQKSAYEAFMTTQIDGDADAGVDTRMHAELRKAATNFSVKFAQEAAEPMATAIYNFTKEIGITLTKPTTIISPHGPCSGMVPITGFKIT